MYESKITKLIKEAKENANNHGWTIRWNKCVVDKKVLSIGDALALLHSELSEALEAYRDNDIEEFSVEIADVFIRLFHLCGDLDINIEKHIQKKMALNKARPMNHGRQNY